VNRTGLTLSAVAATLASLPAAAMLLGLPAAATARASTAPPVTTPAVTTPALQGTCNWAPAHDSGAGHPMIPQSSGGNGQIPDQDWTVGNGQVPDQGWSAGDGHPGPDSAPGTDASGSWHQVSTAGLPDQGHPAGSPCDWTPTYHVGAGHSVTALSSIERGRVSYAAWVGVSIRGGADDYGIATNYGGRWHQMRTVVLRGQFITGITVDSLHPAHAYAVYNDSSRFFHGTDRCGCDGHVFETWNAGLSWTDISGNLRGIVAGVLDILADGRLALATEGGVYTALESRSGHPCWTHLGFGLPKVTVEELTIGSDNCIYARTHGHGTWRFRL
jgi:hypothetical protein